jgi:hypothetical protein
VKYSREQARDLRSGRAWATEAARHPAPPGASTVASSEAFALQLPGLRAALAECGAGIHSLAELQRCHRDLDRALAHAVTLAFSADAQGAPTPSGIVSWAAEGLARSHERELASFAAMDDGGSGPR